MSTVDKGRARKGKRTKISGQWSWRTIEMQRSPAYRLLSLAARRILDRLEIELAAHGGKDNGKLPTTFDQFEEYGIGGRRHIAPAIREVVALGFVEVTERGRAGNAEWRRPSVYRLTYRHTDLSEPTDEWRRIKTIEEAAAIAAEARNGRPKKKLKSSAPKGTKVWFPMETAQSHFLVPKGALLRLVPKGALHLYLGGR